MSRLSSANPLEVNDVWTVLVAVLVVVWMAVSLRLLPPPPLNFGRLTLVPLVQKKLLPHELDHLLTLAGCNTPPCNNKSQLVRGGWVGFCFFFFSL